MNDENRRVILEGNEAREAIKKAVEKVGNIVSATLGPSGRNVILDRARRDRAPLITNDGVSIADEIRMDNECEDLVVQTIVETAKRTNDEAGDGTTTSITIARQMVLDCLEEIGDTEIRGLPGSKDPMAISRKIKEEAEVVISELKEKSDPVDTLEKLKDVTFSSLENKEVGDIVAEAVWEVGKEGFATMEVGYNGIVEKDIVKGMKVYGKLSAPFMATNDKGQAVITGQVPIVVTNLTIKSLAQIQPLIDDMNQKAPDKFNALVVIASKFEADAIKQAYYIQKQTSESKKHATFRFVLVKVPSLTDPEIEDIAAYVHATFINGDTKVGMKADNIKFKDLGFAEKVIVDDEDVVIVGGKGLEIQMMESNPPEKDDEGNIKIMNAVDARIAKVKADMEKETDDLFKKKIERRIGILSGGIAVVKVGAKTDTERSYLQLKVEDALNAAKASLQEGMVKGGGLALKEIAEKHPDFLIANALHAPYQQIQRNAGGKLEIPEGIVDPVKVTRSAFENAVSVARILITTNSIIAEKRLNMVEQLKEVLPIQ